MTIASRIFVFPANAESITGNSDCHLHWDAHGDGCGNAVPQVATCAQRLILRLADRVVIAVLAVAEVKTLGWA